MSEADARPSNFIRQIIDKDLADGNLRGAAELADGGTLFLDELCEMDLDLQTKLLRFIQTGTFQKVGSSKMKSVRLNVRRDFATFRHFCGCAHVFDT